MWVYTHVCVHVSKQKLKVDQFIPGAGSGRIERHGQVDSAKGMYVCVVCAYSHVCVCV